KKYFTEIVQKAEKLIAQDSSNQEIKKIAPKLLAFIEQWIMLEKKYDAKENQIKPQTNEDTIETKIWRSLLDVFQRKHQFALQQYGDLDSDVTESNIVNFVQKVMNNNSFGYKPAGLGSSFSSMSISKLEQYAIYVNMSQIQGSYPVDQDIMDQFQNIIRRSKFLAKPNGINQLSIALRPDTLGEIRLRLTQVGGDMTVKIIVTSQATKEILQSNIHQLKSMFSPHQITIEKLDVNFQSNQELYEKEREQEQANKEDQNHPGQSKQNKQSNEDTEVHFHELLMNEKVYVLKKPTIDTTLYLKNQSTSRSPGNQLGKDEFMKILMTQLQNQDPLNPMDDREFVSQMTTFSSLEQLMNMTSSIDNLVESQLISPVIKYSHLVGTNVSYPTFDEETGEKLDVETSNVIAVSQKDGWAILALENGEEVYADSILQINDTTAEKD